MKKFFLAAIAATLFAALLIAPALAQPDAAAAPAPLPAGTASPRDWDKIAPDGILLPDAIKGDSAILIDAYTGKVLFEKNADDPRYPASTTKIMTCLLALESGKSLSDVVTIGTLPHEDFINGSDHIGLVSGEKIAFEDLLGGMMVKSGNDAADAIAIYVGGSIDNFVDMMNQKAQELGMTGTHYTSTNGLADDTKHVTTPRDMAKLAMAAVKYPEFTKLVSQNTYKMNPDNKHPSPTAWPSTNYLLFDKTYGYQFATGIKTGFTTMAQSSLVSSAEKDGMSLIAVDMHVAVRENMWVDSVTMLEYGFINYDSVDLKELLSNRTIPMTVKDAAIDDAGGGNLDLQLKPQTQGQAYITGRRDAIQDIKDDPSKLQGDISITKDTAPIKQGETVGTVTYNYEGNTVLTCDLIAARDVAMATPAPTASLAGTPSPGRPYATGEATDRQSSDRVILWAAVAVLPVALILLVVLFINMRRGSRRYRRDSSRRGSNARMRW